MQFNAILHNLEQFKNHLKMTLGIVFISILAKNKELEKN